MKIICGTDFSEGSTRALHAASQWARALNDTLVLAHAVDLTLYPATPEHPTSPPAFEAMLVAGAEEGLSQAAKHLREADTTV